MKTTNFCIIKKSYKTGAEELLEVMTAETKEEAHKRSIVKYFTKMNLMKEKLVIINENEYTMA